ncbi:MAG: hypothetical protein QXX51_05335 [Candidatus Bathyarchaeia archaeon]
MKVNWRILVLAVTIGVCITSFTGFVENTPSGVIIPENKYYGFPMIWRISDAFVGEKILYYEFLLDFLFWTAITAIIVLLAKAAYSLL